MACQGRTHLTRFRLVAAVCCDRSGASLACCGRKTLRRYIVHSQRSSLGEKHWSVKSLTSQGATAKGIPFPSHDGIRMRQGRFSFARIATSDCQWLAADQWEDPHKRPPTSYGRRAMDDDLGLENGAAHAPCAELSSPPIEFAFLICARQTRSKPGGRKRKMRRRLSCTRVERFISDE